MTTFSETTLPALIFSVPAGHPKGDVPALGRLTVNEAQAVDQYWVTWGCETNDDYTHTDSTGSGALFYEAESRTAMGGSSTAVGPTGASGGGSNVMRNTSLGTDYVAILSTQASGAGAHLSHVGTFRVYARAQIPSTTGTISVALEWAVGDFRRSTRNDAQTLNGYAAAQWRLLDLGLVSIPKVLTGSQRWEGRILAKSTIAGDDIDIDYLMLVPVTVASGIVSGVPQIPAPSTFIARDDFDQTAGALTGKTAPIGGNWVGAGDADDFSVTQLGGGGGEPHVIRRTATSDAASTGRWVTLDVNQAGVYVQADVSWTSSAVGPYAGVIARYAGTTNWAMLSLLWGTGNGPVNLVMSKNVAGSTSILYSIVLSGSVQATVDVESPWTLGLLVDSGGRWVGFLNGSQMMSGQDSALATGGSLATGDVGVYGENTSASALTLNFDRFLAAAFSTDAAMYASQSLEIRHDGVIREDSAGAIWQPVSSYEGDFNRVPVTGREGRSVRYIVKACRNDPAIAADSGIDDINATLAVTPRYLSVPAPS